MIGFLIFILSFIGLWISFYFTGVFYQWFKPNVFWMPQICQLKEATCMTILDTPRAKLFGYPNSLFGIFLYAYLILDLIFFPPEIALVLLALAVLRSVYLAYSLIYVTKIPCPLCFTSHAINLILFLMVLKIAFYG
ncbi:MAG: vitamin K epoxide reductase family protein [Candidatus Omnitrophica bacterium]|nr:vitamin K epoxide reductase family protein [Candidatus Omnitrophota bacterium]